jgi:hypothetical protein
MAWARSKLNDTVPWNLSWYSEPVRRYLHQINIDEGLGFIAPRKTLRLRRLRTSCRVTGVETIQ